MKVKTVNEEEGKKLMEAVRIGRLPDNTEDNNCLMLNQRGIYITGVHLSKRIVIFEEMDDDEEFTIPLGVLLDQNKPDDVERIVTQFIRVKEFDNWKKEIEDA